MTEVTIDCVCPLTAAGEKRHSTDRVQLRERLDFRSALTARNAIALAKEDDDDISSAEILAILTETYLSLGITSWTLVDEKGKKVEPSRQAIRDFIEDHPDEAMEVGEAADTLYQAAVILPLVARAARSSQPTQTDDSMSVTTTGTPKARKPSKPSLTTTTRMDGTGTISPLHAGGFSS
jgi:hypothetical protein